ncbi:hypothetical protein DFJ63DRAFT_56650 [Scheffersomyces coipomensis]|uniref:uncharacterized protein n=1 Tax=Scheffersomyces coipomensis TaxID=1788519 RepID=UPI00315D126F
MVNDIDDDKPSELTTIPLDDINSLNRDENDLKSQPDRIISNGTTESQQDINDDDDVESIKSTDAILDTNNEDLDTVNSTKLETPNERDLNPDLNRFMSSCQDGNFTLVKELINEKKVGINDTFSDSITGLHWACINNRLTIVKYLIENGADPNYLGGDLKASPLHWACRNGLVYIVDYLLTNPTTKANPSLVDSQQYNALHLAVHSSNITLIIYLLLTCVDSKQIYIDEPDNCNRTCLHWASYQGDILTVNALLKFGADISKVDNTLFLPIHWAFMKGYKSVLKVFVEAGSDIHARTDQNKDCFGVAQDMNCTNTWIKVLKEADLDPKTNYTSKIHHIVPPKLGKIITFLIPYVVLPIGFEICSFSNGFIIPKLFFSVLIALAAIYLTSRFLIPIYLVDDKAIAKSPFLAGIFSGTVFWSVVVFIFKMIPAILFRQFLPVLLLGGLISLFMWAFFKAMFINPGFVPTPTDHSIILTQVKQLIQLGKFDTDHFCVNTFIRKPLRSRYSNYNKKLIARFDHYCPWVYNEIGVRNHKLFMTFVYALNISILLFTYISCKYFDYLEDSGDSNYDSDDEDIGICYLLSDDLCYGYKQHHFHFNLVIWCLLQYVWVVFLCIAQTFQISKGLTTWEFSTLGNKIQSSRFNHSTVPKDLNGFEANGSSSSTDGIADSNNGASPFHRHDDSLRNYLNLIGIDQFVLTIKMTISSIFSRSSTSTNNNDDEEHDGTQPFGINRINVPTDYGIKQNWLDFWILGDEVNFRNLLYLPIEGENNLNGKVVDYYKLYEYPAKTPVNELV